MCIPWKKHVVAALLLLCLPLLMVGCGGGGGAKRVISGVAVKGPIANAIVSVYRLKLDGTRGALVGSGTTGTDGSYDVDIPASVTGPLVVTVKGRAGATYLSESTDGAVPFTDSDSFSAVVTSFTPGVPVAVSPLTEAAFQKLPLVLAQKPAPVTEATLESSIIAANAQVGGVFGVTDILAPPSTDPVYQAALTVIDQMIVDSKASGAITDTTAVMTVINQAVADVDPTAPAYQTFVDVFTTAAIQVAADNPGAVAANVTSVTAAVTTPPTEPDFSDVTAPSVVTGLAATTSAIDSTTSAVVLTWSPSTDNVGVAGYDVYRDGNKIATVVGTTYTDTPVTSNVTYSYTIVAFDAAGNFAAESAPLSVKPNQASLGVTVSGQVNPGL